MLAGTSRHKLALSLHLRPFIVIPVFSETATPVLGPPTEVPNGLLAYEIMTKQQLRALFVPPTIAEAVLEECRGGSLLSKLDFLCFAGGPLTKDAGNSLSQLVMLCQYYGATEMFQVQQLVPSRNDWAYLEWHPECKLEMRPTDIGDGSFELVLLRDTENEDRAAWMHLDDSEEFCTKDLFKRHPQKHQLWQFCGRRDDIVVLSNGEMFNPVPLEVLVSAHHLVQGALVIGQGRSQGILLVEPSAKTTDAERYGLVDSIWPIVENGNALMPTHGRISKSHIMITFKETPLSRIPKGTIMRKLSEQNYATEIERFYSQKRTYELPDSYVHEGLLQDSENVETFVRAILAGCTPLPTKLKVDDDIFLFGLDSLKIVEFVDNLKSGLEQSLGVSRFGWLTTKTIYNCPTIGKLVKTITQSLKSRSSPSIPKDNDLRRAEMAKITDSYVHGLQSASVSAMRHSAMRLSADDEGSRIVLTGSTGNFGSQILKALVSDTSVTCVYCLDRPSSLHLPSPIRASSKVISLKTDMLQPNIGLEETMSSLLQDTVDFIIHASYPVNFNYPLSSFDKTLETVVRLANWALTCRKGPRIIFISSISSVMNYTHLPTRKSSTIPEQLVDEYGAAAFMGYSESKLIAENILAQASTQHRARVSILRVGQIAGSSQEEPGSWPEREWFPALVKTSQSMHRVPGDLPNVDWIPSDLAADIVVELAKTDSTSEEDLRVYNIINPHWVQWSEIVQILLSLCGPDARVVTLQEWVDGLGQVTSNKIDLTERPALRIRDFFVTFCAETEGSVVQYAKESMLERSLTARSLRAIDLDRVKMFAQRWVSLQHGIDKPEM